MRLTNRTAVVLALGTSETLAWGTTYYLPAILAAPIARDLGIPTSWIFGCFSGALLIWAAIGPSIGRRIDRYGGRGVLATSNLVFAAGLVTLGFSHGMVGLIVAWALLGFGMGAGLYDAAFAALTSMYGRSARGPITGITLLAGLASTICWPMTAALDAEFGWRTACFIWAAVHLAVCLPLNLMLGGPGEHAPKTATAAAAPQEMPGQRRTMFLLAFVFAACSLVTGAFAANLPRLLESFGASATAAIAAAALVGPAQVGARLAEFGLMRKAHPLWSARFATATLPVAAMVLALMGTGPVAIATFCIIYGSGNGLLSIVRGTLPLEIFGPAGYGFRSGLIGAPARITQAIGPFVFSMILDGSGPAMALAAASVASLAAVVGLMMIRAATPAASPAPTSA
jgi:predicted MFS family arabinose efflux permease